MTVRRYVLNAFIAMPGLLGALASVPAAAVTACAALNPNTTSVIETTPTSAFTDNANGTVTHNLTGLMWKRCVEGATGAACTGGTQTSWSEALALAQASTTAGFIDWRVPNIKELQSIIEYC